jgi:hypothetical protein
MFQNLGTALTDINEIQHEIMRKILEMLVIIQSVTVIILCVFQIAEGEYTENNDFAVAFV